MTDNEKKTEMMDSERFWAIVGRARWSLTFDYRLSSRLLRLDLPTWEDAEAFSARFSTLRNALCKVIDEFERKTDERVPVSDDGLSDLTSHVVGLGYIEYYVHLNDPMLLKKRAERHDYKESFAYAIPYKEHYAADYQEKREAQRRRDRVAEEMQTEIKEAVVRILEGGKNRCSDLGCSPVRHYARSGFDAAMRAAFPPKNNDED